MDFEEEIALAEASYAAFNRRDLDALLDLYDPACEWDASHFSGWPEKSLYQGLDGLAEFFNVWLEPWDEFQIEIVEANDLLRDRVFLTGHMRVRGRLSGAPVELPPYAQIVEYRAGRILRVETYSDAAEGRRAAGLAER